MPRVALPVEFERRFATGRALSLAPVLLPIGVLFVLGGSPIAPFAVGSFVLVEVWTYWSAYQRAKRMRQLVEIEHGLDNDFARKALTGTAKSSVTPLLLAVLVVGIVYAFIRGGIRAMFLAVIIAFLLLLGLALQWVFYDRWLDFQLRVRQS